MEIKNINNYGRGVINIYTTKEIIETVELQNPSNIQNRIKKVDKDSYVDLETGELIKYQKNDTKNKESLLKTFNNLRRIINANFDTKNSLFLTLTYKENMQDLEQARKDLKKFMRSLKRYHNIEYLAVLEPQGRGAWHYHILLKEKEKENPFIEIDLLHKLWPQGAVFVERIKEVSNLGAYLTAYFTNTETGTKKNDRIKLYPKNCNFYTTSRGVIKPTKEKAIKREFEKDILKNYILVYQKEKVIKKDDKIINSITYKHYKKI